MFIKFKKLLINWVVKNYYNDIRSVLDESVIIGQKNNTDCLESEKIDYNLLPFYKSYKLNCDIVRDVSEIENEYVNFNKPLFTKDYDDLFNELTSEDNFFSDEKLKVLEKIWFDCKKINDSLSKLNDFGISYSLDLVGGSVRDFLLNQHHNIKDLDLSINILGDLKTNAGSTINKRVLRYFFSTQDIEKSNWSELDSVEEKKVKLVTLCLSNDLEKIIHIKDNNNNNTPYSINKKRLYGIIKTKANNYNIDLLFTNLTKPEFIASFDFDICKVSMNLVSPHYKKRFPEIPKYLISRLTADLDFYSDIKNKKISYDALDRQEIDISVSFEDHLSRIKEKYNYDINIYCIDHNNDGYKKAKSIYSKILLDNKIEDVNKNNIKRKIKI